jgi:hypothetical protein
VHTFKESSAKVVTIPHGATVPVGSALPLSGGVSLLTWGLLGPGKGIEWVIDALAMVPELHDKVHYTVAGQTHPKIRANDGESYRDMLKRRAHLLGVSSLITFDDRYRSLDSLLELVNQSTCVVLPYDSDDQITSGVLVDAVSAGRPVIATAFPHADELLATGAGIVVPHRDEFSETVGFKIIGAKKSALYIPDIDKWKLWENSIVKEVKSVDFAFIDGTFYEDGEINRPIKDVPHPFISETVSIFENEPLSVKQKIYFIHLNHTNPAHNKKSPQRMATEKKGFHFASLGDQFILN